MLAIKIYLIFSMLAILWSDVRRYLIPNWLVGSLLLLYPLAVWLSPNQTDWPMAVAGMGITFVIGYGIFAMRWMGAGDIKLLTVCSLWVGFSLLLEFIFTVALLGGALSLLLLAARKILPLLAVKFPKLPPLPRILRNGEPVPYGVAIAVAFLLLLFMGKMALLLG